MESMDLNTQSLESIQSDPSESLELSLPFLYWITAELCNSPGNLERKLHNIISSKNLGSANRYDK